MLAFDIETTGLNRFSDRITVASVHDAERNYSKNFNFCVGDVEGAKRAFLKELDAADVICGFNASRFDLPFIIQRFNVPASQYQKWYIKLFDYFEVAKNVFGSSCGLNTLLRANGEEVKTSSGKQAVIWAEQGAWRELEEYCLADTVLTARISSRPEVVLPLTGKGYWVRCFRDTDTHHMAFEAIPVGTGS